MDWILRELTPVDLHNGFLEALASLSAVDLLPWQVEEVFRQRLGQGVHTYVAVHRQQVVGTASLLVERKFIHRGGLVGHIEDVAVHPKLRRRGVGTQLVEHLTEEARAAGCYKVILNCFPHLVPFYERLGYHKHDECLRLDLSKAEPLTTSNGELHQGRPADGTAAVPLGGSPLEAAAGPHS